MNRKIHQILAVTMLMMAPQVMGQEWMVPDTEASKVNPTDYSIENVKRGKEIYTLNCKSCHGDPGKNNPLALVPLPVDIASEKMQANTEGEIYFKISKGKGVMPPFESTLSEEDRWKLVSFVMNYNPDREAILVEAPPVKAKLLASVNQEKGTVDILAEYENNDAGYSNLEGATVTVSSRKAFGNLEIGQTITNEAGRAEFSIPDDVIGDEQGYMTIVVSLDENFIAQEVALEKAVVANPKAVPRLIQKDVLWSTNNNVSLWLLLSYIFAAGGSWAVIAYVVFQLVKIKRYSKSS